MTVPSLAKGSIVAGRYLLERHLGEGGMGSVWAARHVVTDRGVAMKFLKDTVSHKADVRERFLREARTASALRHPNVVDVLDVFDLDDGTPVMVMELLEGETLGSKLAREERLSVEETAAIISPVISAVGASHSMGIVHRDLKPENIFLARVSDETHVKVLDFGIAKLTAEHYLSAGSALLTDAGSILGTPCYMAPEQIRNEGVDARADIWSLGVILYECLSGTRPIEGQNMAEVIARLTSDAITPLDRLAPELPHEVSALVQHMLTRDLRRRADDLAEIQKVLGRYTHVRAPSFAAPRVGVSSLARPPPSAEQSRASEASSGTMLSAPAVGMSGRRSVSGSGRKGALKIAGALLGLAVALCVWALAGLNRAPRQFESSVVAAPRPSAAAVLPARHSALQAAHSAPTATGFPSSAAPASVDEAPTAVTPPPASAPASAVSAAKRTPSNRKRTVVAREQRSRQPAAASEDVLFPGRK